MSEQHSIPESTPRPETTSGEPAKPEKAAKPTKPRPDFPLTPHPAGYWCKRIKGKLHYFGPWADPDGALAKYLEQKDALHAGKAPRPDPRDLTVKDVANAFLNAKQRSVEAGELSPRTWADYRNIMDMLVAGLGKHKPVSTLDPPDFAALKAKLAKKNGLRRMLGIITVIRGAFKFVYETGDLDRPMRFGPEFKGPAKKVLRLHRAKQGVKLFTAEEIRRMLDAAGVQLRAMILLGINCGYGNSDCGNLPLSALDWDGSVIDFPRPKTGIPRRCPLWPETVQALRVAISQRPEAKRAEHAGLVFVTKYGQGWSKETNSGPLHQEVRKLLDQLGINGRKGLNFYTLRHTFRTVADEAKDQPAADFIMGHEVPHMSSVYREKISDERLKAVADHVRAWLFAEKTPAVE
jgi:integrase